MTVTPVTVVICTRDRGAAVFDAARSVLATSHPELQLIVVDQSVDDSSERALLALSADPRITYLRSSEIGLSRARNLGLRAARTEIVIFTDDDCEVPDNWVEEFQDELDKYPHVAVAFCNVLPGPHDQNAGFIPTFVCRGTRILKKLDDLTATRGIGAGLAVRREFALSIGGFDEELGAGGAFASAEDCDIAVRALLAGHDVCETDRTYVIHHGFRTWAQGRGLARRDWVGLGAAYLKPLRAGRWDFTGVALREFAVNAVWPPMRDALNLRRPRGLGRAGYFLLGAVRAMAAPFDSTQLMFVGEPQFQVNTRPSLDWEATDDRVMAHSQTIWAHSEENAERPSAA